MKNTPPSKERIDELSNLLQDIHTHPWNIGDVISRDGTDEQVIIEYDYSFPTVVVKCIKPSQLGDNSWCEVGEIEPNLMRRYSFVRKGGAKP